jgi:acetate kinase
MDKCGLSTKDADTLLNKKSGFLGLCGQQDVRAVIAEADEGNERAQLAIEVSQCSFTSTWMAPWTFSVKFFWL